MISVKKTALAAAMAMAMSTGVAEAYPVIDYTFNGTFTMYTPGGTNIYNDPAVTGSMFLDFGAGTGIASLVPSTTFFGYYWTATGVTITATGPGVATASMLFNWGTPDSTSTCGVVVCDLPVTVDFSLTSIGLAATGPIIQFVTLDGPSADGIPGNPMCCGPFPGFNATFGGVATPTDIMPAAPVPVPAAFWLFGSGMIGILGFMKRRKSR